MKQTLKNQAQRSGLALAAVAVFAALGTGTAQAATFTSAAVVLDRFGNLECVFRETGLNPLAQVRYDCTAAHVGVLTQCFYRNKPVGNNKLFVFHDVSADHLVNLDVNRNGSIRAAIVTLIPESESNALICTGPSEVAVTTVRWCDGSIVDLTNNLTGASVAELFDLLVANGSGSVPSCATLATLPGLPPGH